MSFEWSGEVFSTGSESDSDSAAIAVPTVLGTGLLLIGVIAFIYKNHKKNYNKMPEDQLSAEERQVMNGTHGVSSSDV